MTSIVADMPLVDEEPSTQPACFIVGCPRSGTTLLSVLLDRHSDLAITPETDFYGEIAPFLSTKADKPLRSLLSAWPRLPELGVSVEAVLGQCGSHPTRRHLFSILLGLYAQRKLKPHVGEKTPQHLHHVPAILDDFPGTPVICIVRDGREVALSLQSMPWWRGSLEASAQIWLDAVRLSCTFQEMFPDQFSVVFYEDLIARPEETLSLLMNRIGLPFQTSQLSAEIYSGVVLPRSLEWKGQALAAVDATQVRSRQAVARASEIQELTGWLGPDLVRLGYAV